MTLAVRRIRPEEYGEVGEEILGSVTWCQVGSPYREMSTSDSQAEFRGLAVAASARGRGAGRTLVEWCLERAREERSTEIVICSLSEMKPAHSL